MEQAPVAAGCKGTGCLSFHPDVPLFSPSQTKMQINVKTPFPKLKVTFLFSLTNP